MRDVRSARKIRKGKEGKSHDAGCLSVHVAICALFRVKMAYARFYALLHRFYPSSLLQAIQGRIKARRACTEEKKEKRTEGPRSGAVMFQGGCKLCSVPDLPGMLPLVKK